MYKKIGLAALTLGMIVALILILSNELNWNQSTLQTEENENNAQQNDDDVDRTGYGQREDDNHNDETDDNKENHKNGSKENEDPVPEPDAVEVLTDYRNTTESIFESRDEDLRIPDIDSKRDMVEHVNSVMSVELGRLFAETYFEERDDGLYVIPKDGLTYLAENEPYEVEKVSETEYHVIQERDTPMLGHINMIYHLAYDGENWVVDSIDSEDLS
ncbi:hypothetical protein QA612_01770 [Evansella sp. AB-P1]|uniref:hypothetical protein n=1 Tax=Evansella sp. AB-P1 TaxID=3037653 RepID=UPI00241CB9AD|nr:hypothetical protein [Evansella sp. AB-P1]MDG5786201.1 hypothetical protein [Evansella sp. AB-P1]